MKKRLSALLLCFCLLLSLFPTGVIAVDGDPENGGDSGLLGAPKPPAPPEEDPGDPESPASIYFAYFKEVNITMYQSADSASSSSSFNITGNLKDLGLPLIETVEADGTVWCHLDISGWNANKKYSYIPASEVVIAPGTGSEGEPLIATADVTDPADGSTYEVGCVMTSDSFPAKTTPTFQSVSLSDIEGFDTELYPLPEHYLALEIGLEDRSGNAVQPTSPVSVTLSAGYLGEEGDDMLVYHVHTDDAGVVTVELLGPYLMENGSFTFEMSQFSYVIAFNGTVKITGVTAIYPASGTSGNGHIGFVAVYYDEQNNLHLLLCGLKKTASTICPNVSFIWIDQHPVTDFTYSVVQDSSVTSLVVLNGTDSILTLPLPGNYGIADFNIGQVQIQKEFEYRSSTSNSMPDKANGWDLINVLKPQLSFSIAKTVAKGTAAQGATFGDSLTVNPGDWVIYKIDLVNNGALPLTGMLVKDSLPTGVFDPDSVMMSIDGDDGAIGNWQSFSETLFSNYSADPGDTRQLYIKAQVKTDLNITSDTDYVNTATMDGMNMPAVEDSATITVKKPKGGLTVSKAVSSENPSDPAPDDSFEFTIASANGFSKTITLKNNESFAFDGSNANHPILTPGTYTVTETAVSGYSTKVNGTTGNSITVTVTNGGHEIVAFENRFSTRVADYTIYHVDREDTSNVLKTVSSSAEVGTLIPVGPMSSSEIPAGYVFDDGESDNGVSSSGILVTFGEPNVAYVYYKLNEFILTFIVDGEVVQSGAFAVGADISGEEPTPTKTYYTFDGWYTDDAYTTAWTNPDVMPAQDITVYGHFIRNTASLKITKSGMQANESAVFTVSGADIDGSSFSLRVSVRGNSQSVIIPGLPQGNSYTVTEDTSWSWKYTVDQQTRTAVLGDGDALVEVRFTNTARNNTTGYDGEAYAKNVFDKIGS